MQAKNDNTVPFDPNRSQRGTLVPPQALEAEEAILGGVMIDQGALERVLSVLKPEHFYLGVHSEIYQAALSLHESGEPIDMMTVVGQLHRMGVLEKVGGQNRIADLVEACVSAVNIEAYAKLVVEKFNRRQMMHLAQELQRKAQDESQLLIDVQDWAEAQIFSMSDSAQQKGLRAIADILDEECNRMQSPQTEGIKTGFYDLDNLTRGFKSHQLITVAGRPGSGKSSFAAAALRNIAAQGHPAALFSLEMAGGEVGNRLLSSEAMIDSRILESGDLTDDQWVEVFAAKDRLSKIPIEIDESRTVTPGHILTESRRMKAKYGMLGMVVVDYLHLMLDEEDEVKQLGKLTRFFKKMTRELDAPVMILSQLNRGVEARAEKRPVMSDLRQSGRIEEDSDIVLLLYRDEYYNPETDDRGIAEVIIAKNRSGPTGTVKLLFHPEFSTFRNLAKSATHLEFSEQIARVPGSGRTLRNPPISHARLYSSQPKIESNNADSDDDEWTEVEEVEVEQSREFQGKTFYLGRKYLISVDGMDAESLKEMRKTPDFDAKLGVGKVVTATGWDLRYSFYPQVECVHADGTKQVFSPTCLKEIES